MKKRADYNVQTLEDQVLVDATEAVQGINQLKSGIASLKAQIDSFSKNNGLSNFNKQAKQSTEIVSALKKTINFSAIYLGARQALSTLKEMTNESINYTETANLFNVSFGKNLEGLNQYYEQALDFQERLEEKLGVNIEESMRYQALFNSMTKSMGLSAQYAYTLSENTTKLGYDLASLYNIDTESAMTKLRAGLAGQTEPLRELGLDITEQSLKPVAESLGITESIRNMTQAEKTVLRYIAVLRQAQIAQGDFARTMDSPANQLRIFNAQVTAFKRNMGNLWQGILGGILPYVNAVMMVINELLKMVAKLFGFEITSQPVNVSASVGADDLADDLGTASGKAKELKNQLMGFDEIHNITLDTGSGGGTSGGTSIGGIDQRLLDAIKEYDNLMDSVSNKATEIRDKMMEWLGFVRTDDGWKLKDELTNLEKIFDIVKLIGIAFGTWKVSSTITNLLKNLGVLNANQAFQMAFGITLTLTGISAQWQGTEHLLNGDVDLFTILETLLGTAGGTFGIVNMLKSMKIGQVLKLNEKVKIGLGIMLAIQGIQVITDGIKNGDIKKQLIGSLETGLGAVSGFSAYGGLKYGLKMGIIFTIATIEIELGVDIVKWWTENWDKYKKELYKNKVDLNLGEMLNIGLTGVGEGASSMFADFFSSMLEGLGIIKISREELSKYADTIKETVQGYRDSIDTIKEKITTNNKDIEGTRALTKELEKMIDSNGRVKEGYESRVDIILGDLNSALGTEISRDGEIIKNNGEVVKSYGELQETIENTIKQRQAELRLEAYGEIYKESIKEKAKLQSELAEATEKQKDAQAEYLRLLQEGADLGTINVALSNVREADNAVYELTEGLKQCNQEILDSNQKMVDSTVLATGQLSAEMITQRQISQETLTQIATEYKDQWTSTYESLDEETRQYMLAMSTTVEEQAPVVIEKWTALAKGSYDNFKLYLDQVTPEAQASLLGTLTTTEGLTPNIVQAWSDLANQSAVDFNNGIKNLPEDVQSNILTSIAKVEGLTENTRTAWADLAQKAPDEYNKAISELPSDTREEIENAVTEINNKKWQAESSGRDIGSSIKREFDSGIDGTDQSGRNFVQGFLDIIGGPNPLNVLNKVKGLGRSIISYFNRGLDEHSPSKETAKSARYFILGFTNQMDRQSSELLQQVKNMAVDITDEFDKNLGIIGIDREIKINPQDFTVNTNQFIDYGTIAGNINTQTRIVTNDLPEQVKQAVIEGMSQVQIPVEIEARADEGIIFKKVQIKAKEYAIQTGENPFPNLA